MSFLKLLFAALLLAQLAFIPRLQSSTLLPERTAVSAAFTSVLRQPGINAVRSQPVALRSSFEKLDVDRDGFISWEEFTQRNVSDSDERVEVKRLRNATVSKQNTTAATIQVIRSPPRRPALPARTRDPPSTAPLQSGINCGAVLNLATTFIEGSTDPIKIAAQESVLQNYQRLRDAGGFQGYLFTQNETWANRARAHGVYVFAQVEANEHGTPKLKPMFQKMMEISNKKCGPPVDIVFEGYANGDIVFAQSLLSTLETLRSGWRKAINDGARKGVLLVGRRTNVEYKGEKLASDDALLHFAVKGGKIFPSYAEDYFIYTRSAAGPGNDWREVPDFVVGRLAYDNWLVDHAYHDARMDLVDGTETVLAVHLTAKDGNRAGHSKGSDTHWNKGLLNPITGKSIGAEFSHGKTHHCPFATKLIRQGNASRSETPPEIVFNVRRDAAPGRSLPAQVRPAAAPAVPQLPDGELEAKKIYDLPLLQRLASDPRLTLTTTTIPPTSPTSARGV